MDALHNLFFPTQFIPHGHCYLWQPELVWLHLLSDVLIAIAYYSIPIMLIYFVRKREDVPFPGIFLLFGLFITTCGTTHLMAVWTLWHPAYWLSGTIKAITAVVSIYTALALIPTIPAALALPKPEVLKQINQQLGTEIEERKQAEAALQYQLKFDQLIAEISTQFINLKIDTINDKISQALKTIGQFIQVETSYIFQLDHDANTFSMDYEWVKQDPFSQIHNAQKIPFAAFPWALETLNQGDILQVPSVAQLPEAAKLERENWQQFNLQSLICLPLISQERLMGWVGFASFQQESAQQESAEFEQSIQLLRMFAEIVARALQRQQSELELRHSKDQLQMALEAGKTTSWEHNLATDTIQGFGRLIKGQWHGETWQTDGDYFPTVIHPDDSTQVHQAIATALKTKDNFVIEHRFAEQLQGSHDRNQWGITKGKVLTNDVGEAVRIVGLTVDITERKYTELALRESEERWQLALRGTNAGIWDWNVETDEVFFSARFKQMLGYEDFEFPNHSEEWTKRIHPDDVDRVNVAVQEHFDQDTPFYQTQHRLLCKDGTYKWVFDQAKALRDETGKVIRMTGSHTDITKQKRAEAQLKQLNQDLEARVEARTAALQESEKRFRSLFESAPDFIYVLNQDGMILQVNPTVINRSGYEKSELLGQPLPKFLSSQTQATCQQEFSSLLSSGNHRAEMEFVCKDGQILIMDCSCTLVKESPSEGYILVLQRDITERQKVAAERQQLLATVQRSDQRWRSFLDNVRLMVVGLDTSGRINYVNPHFLALMGYQSQEIEGKNGLAILLPKYEQEQQQDFFQSLMDKQKPSHHASSVLTCCNKEEKVIAWNTTVLKDSHGDSTGLLSIGEDITERYAIDRMKDEFISVVSHELRTPLTSIHGALDLLTSGLLEPQSDRGQHVLNIAAENSSRLVHLVNDILELERLESGKVKLHQASVSTHELTQRAYELMELVAEREEIKLIVAATDLLIWADGDRLIQVLTNLLSNAIKFSPTSSIIWVSAEELTTPDGHQVKFTVKDQGRGIPSHKLERIFERFHQVDASDSRNNEGTGLGLAICNSIVHQHGGKIWAESTLGEGSCFSFTVPMSQQIAPENSTPDNFSNIKN